jgi:DNA-binding response OmpR family regulator
MDLVDMVWKDDINIDEHTVNVNIKRLRDKLGKCKKHIKTVQGLGYRFNI